jgi:hypothetical protein
MIAHTMIDQRGFYVCLEHITSLGSERNTWSESLGEKVMQFMQWFMIRFFVEMPNLSKMM